MKPSLKSSSAIYDYVEVQQLDDIFARFGDKKQTRRQNMAEIVFSWGVSEIKCIIFNENNEIDNNYIKLSIVFHPMIIVLNETYTNSSYTGPRLKEISILNNALCAN
jgi:hypothetical protein